jgi:hypothetical protein
MPLIGGTIAAVNDLRCVRNGRVVHIELQSTANCEREILAAEQKRELFERAFNCRLSFGRGLH